MKRLALTAASMGMLATIAMAADMPIVEAPMEATVAGYDWSGFYAGVHGGYAWGDADWDVTEDGLGFLDEPGLPVDLEGGFGGGQIGYNMQSGNFVYGLELEVAIADIDGFNYNDPNNDGYETTLDWFGTFTGRVGFAFDRALIYAKGGLAFGGFEHTVGDIDGDLEFDPSVGTADDDSTEIGFAVGGGVEYGITENISVKAEYMYVDFGDIEFSGVDSVGGAPVVADIDTNFHTVKGGINFRF